MKRVLVSLLAIACVGAALAQAPFTIVRPADGSKVRESVHLLFPKNSVPDNGYIGIFVNNKFIEATIPQPGSRYLDYTLNTKGLGLPDGPATIEAVLYVDFNDKPRVIDKSSIQVTIANKANINIPENGLLLRYHWAPGHQWNYRLDVAQQLDSIKDAQARLGGRASQVPIQSYSAEMIYAVDNVYPDGDALLRMSAAPLPGKKSLVLPINGDPRRFYENQMYPVYMRLKNNGWEVFGVIPQFFATAGLGGSQVTPTDLIKDDPLPALPVARVKPGDTWATRFQLGSIKAFGTTNDTLTAKIPARGEFVGVEWEMGHPCAKIHHSFSIGSGGPGLGAEGIRDNARSIDETFWYALDRGVIVKLVRTQVRDSRVGSNEGGVPGVPSTQNPAVPHLRGPNGGGGFIFPQRGPVGAGGGDSTPAPGPRGPAMGGAYNPYTSQNRVGTVDQAAGPGGELLRLTITEVFTLEK